VYVSKNRDLRNARLNNYKRKQIALPCVCSPGGGMGSRTIRRNRSTNDCIVHYKHFTDKALLPGEDKGWGKIRDDS